MTLEEDLRLTFTDEAGKPVPRPDLLDSVRVGVRRDQRKRTAIAGAAVVLAAVVAVPVVLVQRQQSPAPAPPAPAASVPSGPTPSATGVVWEKARLTMPGFPLTPGWVPGGLGPRRVDQLGPNLVLRYDDGADVLSAEVGPTPGDWEVEGDQADHHATVGLASATVRTTTNYDGATRGDRYVGVRWQRADGSWVQVISLGRRTESQVLRFARGLRPRNVPASPAPFELAEVPGGLTLSFVSTEYLCLAPQPVTRETMQTGLCVGVQSQPGVEGAPGSEFTVGGRKANFANGSQLQIDLGHQRVLTVDADPETTGLGPGDLVRFATGVRVAGA